MHNQRCYEKYNNLNYLYLERKIKKKQKTNNNKKNTKKGRSFRHEKNNIIPPSFKPYIFFIFIFLSDLKSYGFRNDLLNAKALDQCIYILSFKT